MNNHYHGQGVLGSQLAGESGDWRYPQQKTCLAPIARLPRNTLRLAAHEESRPAQTDRLQARRTPWDRYSQALGRLPRIYPPRMRDYPVPQPR